MANPLGGANAEKRLEDLGAIEGVARALVTAVFAGEEIADLDVSAFYVGRAAGGQLGVDVRVLTLHVKRAPNHGSFEAQ